MGGASGIRISRMRQSVNQSVGRPSGEQDSRTSDGGLAPLSEELELTGS